MMYGIKMNDELAHYGILGMRWGIRRYQNKDGSLTAAGKKKRKIDSLNEESKDASRPKKLSEMSDSEIGDKIKRMQLEKNYIDLEKQLAALKPQQISKGKKFIKMVWDKALLPATQDASKKIVDLAMKKLSKELLGDDGNDAYEKLKKEVDVLALKRRKIQMNDWFKERKENNSKPKSSENDVDNKKEKKDVDNKKEKKDEDD